MTKKRYFNLFISDLDGTLIDSEDLIVNCVKSAAKKRSIVTPKKKNILNVYYKTPAPTRLLKSFGMSKESDRDNFWQYYMDNLDQLSLKDRNLIKLLNQLNRDGIKFGLVTSLSERIARLVLNHFSINKLLESSRFYKWGYSKQRAICDVAGELGVDVSEALYLGDSPNDIKSAQYAGCWSGAIAWDNGKLNACRDEGPDFLFYNFEAIIELLLRKFTDSEDYLTPSRICYTPHNEYLRSSEKIPRSTCRYCLFPSDCWNCKRFSQIENVPFKDPFLKSLEKYSLDAMTATEWYIDQWSDAGHDVSKTLRAFKKGNHEHLFRISLSVYQHLLNSSKSQKSFRDFDMIIPIPQSKKKSKKGVYNPPTEIAKVLSALLSIPIQHPLQRKSNWTMREYRTKYDFEKRIKKYSLDLIVARKIHVKNKRILLVDDVVTDGATLLGTARGIRELLGNPQILSGIAFGCTRKYRHGT